MNFMTRLWRKIFPLPQPPQWADTAEKEFGLGAFRYVTGTYAKAGDVVTCENGHAICVFQHEVNVGDDFNPTALGAWTQPEPKLGAINVPCATCGARWFKWPYLHFADGWRLGRLPRHAH